MIFRKKKEVFYYTGMEVPQTSLDKYKCLDATTRGVLEKARGRISVVMFVFAVCFIFITGRLFHLSVMNYQSRQFVPSVLKTDVDFARYNIEDRNGMILATSVPTKDLSVNPQKVKEKDRAEAVKELAKIFTDIPEEEIRQKLTANARFRYIKRNITPIEQQEINKRGYYFLQETDNEKRVYPQGNLFSHLLGNVDIDNHGIAGLEKAYDTVLQEKNLTLSLDLSVQEIVHKTLAEEIQHFKAEGGLSIVMDVNTAEVLASVSLPDYNPNLPVPEKDKETLFNKTTLGAYEFGSIFKLFNTAMALDSGVIKPTDSYDATRPFNIGRKSIQDFRGQNRPLLVPEILIHSSNLGSARIALKAGYQRQREFLGRLGFYKPLPILLPERTRTQFPRAKKWADITVATTSYGYGVSVSPLHLISAISALVNGGYYRIPTFLKGGNTGKPEYQVVSEKTSDMIRHMMWGVINWKIKPKDLGYGYNIGGKTGTANLIRNGKYTEGSSRTTFVGVFPMNDPKYAVMVTLENPKKLKETYGFNNAGWNAKPTGMKIIEQIAPYLGIAPGEQWEQPAYMRRAIEISREKNKGKL